MVIAIDYSPVAERFVSEIFIGQEVLSDILAAVAEGKFANSIPAEHEVGMTELSHGGKLEHFNLSGADIIVGGSLIAAYELYGDVMVATLYGVVDLNRDDECAGRESVEACALGIAESLTVDGDHSGKRLAEVVTGVAYADCYIKGSAWIEGLGNCYGVYYQIHGLQLAHLHLVDGCFAEERTNGNLKLQADILASLHIFSKAGCDVNPLVEAGKSLYIHALKLLVLAAVGCYIHLEDIVVAGGILIKILELEDRIDSILHGDAARNEGLNIANLRAVAVGTASHHTAVAVAGFELNTLIFTVGVVV